MAKPCADWIWHITQYHTLQSQKVYSDSQSPQYLFSQKLVWRWPAGGEADETNTQHGTGMSASTRLIAQYHTATFVHLVTSGISKLALPERCILKDSELGCEVQPGKFFIDNVFWTKHAITRNYFIDPFSVGLFALFVLKKKNTKNIGGIHVNGLYWVGFFCNKSYFFGLKAPSVLVINTMMNTSCWVWWSISNKRI